MSRIGITAGKAVIRVYIDDLATNQLKKINSSVMKFSYGLKNIGDQAIRGGLIGSITSGFLTNKFIKFEDAILELRAKMELLDTTSASQNATVKDMENFIRQLGKTTSFTADEIAHAAIELAAAGFKAEEIKNTLVPVLDLARAGNYSLGESADFVANVLRTFNLETINAADVVDKFVKAAQLGTVSIGDLRESLKYASGSAANLSQDLSTVLALLVQASESGLKASLGGTSFNTMLNQMASKFRDLEMELPEFKVKYDKAGTMDLIRTMQSLYGALDGLGQLDKQAKITDIFNLRGMRFAEATKEFQNVFRLVDEIRDSTGVARQSAVVMDSGLGGSLRRANGAANDFVITLGEINKELQTAALNVVPTLMAKLSETAKRYALLTVTIANAPYVLLGAGAGMLAVAYGLSRVAVVAGLAQKAMSKLIVQVRAGFGGVGGLALGGTRYIQSIRAAQAARAKIIATYNARIAKETEKNNKRLAKATTPAKQAAAQARNAAAIAKINKSKLGQAAAKARQPSSMMMGLDKIASAGSKVISAFKSGYTRVAAGIAKVRQYIDVKQRIKAAKSSNRANRSLELLKEERANKIRLVKGIQNSEEIKHKEQRKIRDKYAKKNLNLSARGAKLGSIGSGMLDNVFKGMRSGMSGIKGLMSFKNLGVAAKGVFTFTKALASLTYGFTRFVISLNPIGLAFNILLLFGHKIPFVVNSFKALGEGFSSAFRKISEIGSGITSPLNLITYGLKELATGNVNSGLESVSQGFKNVADVITNKLMAAWYAFKIEISTGLDIIYRTAVSIGAIFEGLISGISAVGSGLAQNISGTLGKAGVEGPKDWNMAIHNYIQKFLTGIEYISGIFLSFQDFLWNWQDEFILKFGNLLSKIPGLGSLANGRKGSVLDSNIVSGLTMGVSKSLAQLIPKEGVKAGIEANKTQRSQILSAQQKQLKETFRGISDNVTAAFRQSDAKQYNTTQRNLADARAAQASKESATMEATKRQSAQAKVANEYFKKQREEAVKAQQAASQVKARKEQAAGIKMANAYAMKLRKERHAALVASLGLEEKDGSFVRGRSAEAVARFQQSRNGRNVRDTLSDNIKAAEMSKAGLGGQLNQTLQEVGKVLASITSQGTGGIGQALRLRNESDIEQKQLEALEEINTTIKTNGML